MGAMRIGELADQTGISTQAIRFYERRRLLAPPDREANGYREYNPTVALRLTFIRTAQAAGLTLTEIGEVLAVRDAEQAPCGHVTGVLAQKLDEVHARQRDLASLEAELQQLLEAARRLDPADCTASEICHIIARAHPA